MTGYMWVGPLRPICHRDEPDVRAKRQPGPIQPHLLYPGYLYTCTCAMHYFSCLAKVQVTSRITIHTVADEFCCVGDLVVKGKLKCAQCSSFPI